MCDLDHDNFDNASVFKQSFVTARKPHVCECCGGQISPGSKYVKHFSVYDGSVSSEKACTACETMAEEFQRSHGMRMTPGGMPEALQLCIDEEGANSESGRRWLAELTAMQLRREARG